MRFRYYEPPTVVGVEPTAGPSAGGTVVLIAGAGMLANALHGGHLSARCRVGAAVGLATIVDESTLACASPAAEAEAGWPPIRTGRAAVRVSLNGGADWHAHANGTSLAPWRAAPPPAVYEYECAADASPSDCLLTAGCGWCYAAPAVEGSGENIGACMPCTPSAIAGRPADCAAGAAYPQRCDARSWTYSAPLELPPGGGVVFGAVVEVAAGRMRHLSLTAPHPHGRFRVAAVSESAFHVYGRRGALPSPHLHDVHQVGGTFPQILELPMLIGAKCDQTDEGCAAETWQLALQGAHFYEELREYADGDPIGLELGVYDRQNRPLTTAPPGGGSYWVRANASSVVRVAVAWDFRYASFDLDACGGDAAPCGLVALGGAAVGAPADLRPYATVPMAEAAALGGGAPVATLLRPRAYDVGAVWHREPLPLRDGFETSFDFRVFNGSFCAAGGGALAAWMAGEAHACSESLIGGPGFSFVLHDASDGADARGCAGEAGGGLWPNDGCTDCVAPALAVRFDTHVGLGVAKPPVLSDEEMYTQNATALPPDPPEDVPWEGPLSDYEQERHARRKDAERAQAFAKLHREDPDLQSVRWEARNRVRLVWRPSCAAEEEVLAGIDIGLPMMLVLDDGETHRAVVRYIPPRFEIEVDGERMLSVRSSSRSARRGRRRTTRVRRATSLRA